MLKMPAGILNGFPSVNQREPRFGLPTFNRRSAAPTLFAVVPFPGKDWK